MPSRPLPGSPTRRRALGLLALAALGAPLAGCSRLPALDEVRVDPDWPGAPAPPVPDADELARREAAGAAGALRASAALLEPDPAALAPALALVVDVCAVHREQLGEPVDAAAPTATATGAPSAPAPSAEALVAEAPSAEALLAELVAAAGSARAAVPGTSPGLARLLTSVAASRALLAESLAAAAALPAPAAPPLPAPADGDAVGSGEPGATGAPVPRGAAALLDVVDGQLAASRAAEVAAAALGDDDRARALALRDALVLEAQALAGAVAGGPTPVPAPGYALPGPVTGPEDAVGLVVVVLERLAATALEAVPALDGEERLLAADVLARTSVTAAAWRPRPADAATLALPGTAAP
ncbi:DUF4439 domain-containing protein [uncultured Pseudokineococcus sp.]|uniref:DUF4439 domain-containing protein n=1 Tax=uncultured Pseudokineococcus sp. TaxID=1642928 RepID=UPI00260BAF70|nr:DUF4439 domain-containing protein [uncultured Pseudokineococcus sp.]